MTFIPSPQQSAFLDWVSNGSGSCILEAVAGAGKTTTLLEAVDRTSGGVAILAYNRKIADEIRAKLTKRGVDWKKAEANTVHGFGLRAYKKTFPNVVVDGRKVSNIVANLSINAEPGHVLRVFSEIICNLVSLAKQRAIGILASIDDDSKWHEIVDHFDLTFNNERADERLKDIIAQAQRVLRISNDTTGVIDFDDMVYLPVLLKLRFWQYAWVFVDEAQDTNPARRALVRALVRPGGRVVAVGDRHQAIYGFTGADADSLDLIRRDFDAVEMPLTITYRCPKEIVGFARKWVGHIEAHESAPEGIVSYVWEKNLLEQNDLTGGTAILCRNTKPLVKLAFEMIRARIPCRVEGRDIGLGLKKLATKWSRVKTTHGLEQQLNKWCHAQKTLAMAKGNEMRAQSVQDQRDTLFVITAECRKAKNDSVQAVCDYIDELFSDDVQSMLVLSTGHKSKGREWDSVYILNLEDTIPSPYARKKWQLEQERNLAYVMVTRSKNKLCLVSGHAKNTTSAAASSC